MSDTVLIIIVIAIAVVVILFMFRSTLSRFFLKASKDGLEAELEAREDKSQTSTAPRAGVNISGATQVGSGHKIDVGRDDVNVSEVKQLGKEQEIVVRPDELAQTEVAESDEADGPEPENKTTA